MTARLARTCIGPTDVTEPVDIRSLTPEIPVPTIAEFEDTLPLPAPLPRATPPAMRAVTGPGVPQYEIVAATVDQHVTVRMHAMDVSHMLAGYASGVLYAAPTPTVVESEPSDGIPRPAGEVATRRLDSLHPSQVAEVDRCRVFGCASGEIDTATKLTPSASTDVTTIVPTLSTQLTYAVLHWIEELLVELKIQERREIFEAFPFRLDSPEGDRPQRPNCVKLLVRNWAIFRRWYLDDFAAGGFAALAMALGLFEPALHAAALELLVRIEKVVRDHQDHALASLTLTF